MTDTRRAQECADLLQALAEPSRIRIIDCLRTGAKHVSQLAELLGAEIVNVSHHLGVLRNARMVQSEKQGRFVIYTLAPEYFGLDAAAGDTLVALGWCTVRIPQG